MIYLQEAGNRVLGSAMLRSFRVCVHALLVLWLALRPLMLEKGSFKAMQKGKRGILTQKSPPTIQAGFWVPNGSAAPR